MAALASNEKDLILTFKCTLETIFKYQHDSGIFPSNVVPKTGEVSYGGAVGRADNPSWAVIGLCSFLKKIHSEEMRIRHFEQVKKAFELMNAWEYNGKHLIYVPMSGDWADEYIQHGYILFDQLLRLYALELAYEEYKIEIWKDKAKKIREVITLNYWGANLSDKTYLPLLNREKAHYPESFWLMGFNPGEIYPQFDLQANALALLLKVGSAENQESVITYLKHWFDMKRQLYPSFYPSIQEVDTRMKYLKNNFAYTFRNQPNEFHNGGVWPVWNGFLIGILKNIEPKFSEKLKKSLDNACYLSVNKDNKWEFNECLNSKSGLPNGVPKCTWSAAGYILAEKGIYEN
ncbi:MAG: fructofuranosidase/invertase [Bacteroidia bacterium]